MDGLLQEGDFAPDFTLPSVEGTITLSEVLKSRKAVLLFYVLDFTGG